MGGRLITLVGYRASGKTSLARCFAADGWRVRDLDRVLEERAGRSIAAIFASDGTDAFRDHEHAALCAVLTAERDADLLLATGGGVVERADNRALLRSHGGTVLYLAAPSAVLADRLRDDDGGRPSLTGVPVADEVATVLARRDPWYRAVADHVVAADRPWPAVVAAVRAIVENT